MYKALYRKYRPKSFDEIYGQEIAKTILINSLKTNKIEHAYLFFGPRGTGKTSIAKMFAKIVNCSSRIDEKQCNECDNCKNISDAESVDIIEIDAASNNGVEEIRELKSKINLVPSILKYKVYIIDEVHMLSTSAFNALLKTLEEPPEHIIFILATTEYYKVPSTIVSRCQTIEFKNIDFISMKNRLAEIAKLENIEIDDQAITEIINNSNGGMRDAIGLLDKMQLYCNKKISIDDVRKVMGSISITEIDDIYNCLINNNIDILLEKINNYSEQGYDLVRIFDDLIYKFDNTMLEDKNYEYLPILNILIDFEEKIRSSNNKKIIFELAILTATNKTNVRKIISREIISEKKDTNVEKQNDICDNNDVDIYINNAFFTANKKSLLDVKTKWENLNKYVFDIEYGSICSLLLESVPVVCGSENLILSTKYDAEANKINLEREKIQKFLEEYFSVSYIVTAIVENKWEQCKKEYIKNKENGIEYKYIKLDESKKSEDKSRKENNIKDKAIELFGNIVS